MNKIYVDIDFTNGTLDKKGIDLITGDYASTEIEFTFDEEHSTGRKTFEMKSPNDEVVFVGDIEDNKILLAGKDENENNVSLFEYEGYYIFEVSYYEEDSKLTSVYGKIPVRKEQVVIGDEIVEPYLPIFDELIQEVDTKISEMESAMQGVENLNVEAEKVEHTTTITITRKDGTSYDVQVLDGEQGPQGERGPAGVIRIIICPNGLPETGEEGPLYEVPKEEPTIQDLYDEYMWVDNKWELMGEKKIAIDLTDYVKNTDYASGSTAGITRSGNGITYGTGYPYADEYDYTRYSTTLGGRNFIGKTTLENVITGKGLVSNTDYASTSTGGVVKVGWYNANVDNTGHLFPIARTYEQYLTDGDAVFIAKGTLENVLTARIGDISSVIDAINGESI